MGVCKMRNVKQFFEFERYKTSYRQETLAGLTTFLTMSYIIIVNPAIHHQCHQLGHTVYIL